MKREGGRGRGRGMKREGGGMRREGGGEEGGMKREGGRMRREGGGEEGGMKRDEEGGGGMRREGGGMKREGGGMKREGGGMRREGNREEREGGVKDKEGRGEGEVRGVMRCTLLTVSFLCFFILSSSRAVSTTTARCLSTSLTLSSPTTDWIIRLLHQ